MEPTKRKRGQGVAGYLDADTFAAVQDYAEETGLAINAIVTAAVREFVARLPKKEEPK